MQKLARYTTGISIGICAEYLYRVEINPYPIAILVLLTIATVMDCFMKKW